MEKIKEKYNNECDIKLSYIGKIYKRIGVVLSILYICVVLTNYNLSIIIFATIIYFIIMCLTFCILNFIYKKSLYKKLKVLYKVNFGKNVREYERVLDDFQKKWISDYIRKNKINKLGKLSIIIDEITKEIDNKLYKKYIDIIIMPAIFNFFINIVNLNYEKDIMGLLTVVVICILTTYAYANLIDKIDQSNVFNKYSGLERLKELLVHASLKHGR